MNRSHARFDGELTDVPRARRFAETHLGLAFDEDLGDVAVTVSELVTNAIRHGTPPIEVAISTEEGRVRVEVTDHGGGEPQPRNPEVTAPDGRGLALIDVLADEWGASIVEGRTTVWAAFAVDHVLDSPA